MHEDLSQNPLGRPFLFEGNRDHGVLLLHGFLGSPGSLLPLGEALADAGYYVRGILLPGHGTTMEEMQQYHWQDWQNAVFEAYDEMIKICKKVSVIGLSMGGTLACLLAEHRPVSKLVTLAAALKVQSHAGPFAGILSHLIPTVPCTEKTDHDYLLDHDVCYHTMPVRSVVDLNKLASLARKDLKKITCPFLVVKAGKDCSVHPDSAKWLILNSSSVEKKLLVLPNSPHVCTLGTEKDLLFAKIITFLKDN